MNVSEWTAGKWTAVIFGAIVSIVLLIFSAVTTIRFMQSLLPAYGVGLAICLLFAVDLATIGYALAFVYDADSFLRQAISGIMVGGNFTANVIVMISNFVLFGGQNLDYPEWLPWVVTIAVGGWIMANIGSGLGYWLASPSVRSRIMETTAQAKLESARHKLALAQVDAQIDAIATAQAGTFAQGFVNSQMQGHGNTWQVSAPPAQVTAPQQQAQLTAQDVAAIVSKAIAANNEKQGVLPFINFSGDNYTNGAAQPDPKG